MYVCEFVRVYVYVCVHVYTLTYAALPLGVRTVSSLALTCEAVMCVYAFSMTTNVPVEFALIYLCDTHTDTHHKPKIVQKRDSVLDLTQYFSKPSTGTHQTFKL